jgi:hypothetical protein
MGGCGGIGRRSRLKICRWRHRGGSSPFIRIILKVLKAFLFKALRTFLFFDDLIANITFILLFVGSKAIVSSILVKHLNILLLL